MSLLRGAGALLGAVSILFSAYLVLSGQSLLLWAAPLAVFGAVLALACALPRLSRRRKGLFACLWLAYAMVAAGSLGISFLQFAGPLRLAVMLLFLAAGASGALRAIYLATRRHRPGLMSYYESGRR